MTCFEIVDEEEQRLENNGKYPFTFGGVFYCINEGGEGYKYKNPCLSCSPDPLAYHNSRRSSTNQFLRSKSIFTNNGREHKITKTITINNHPILEVVDGNVRRDVIITRVKGDIIVGEILYSDFTTEPCFVRMDENFNFHVSIRRKNYF